MAKEVRTIGSREREAHFTNGTILEAPALVGEITQWRGARTGLRSAMLPGERDMSPQFEAALDEVGIRVQETLHFEVQNEGAAVQRRGRSAAADDRLILRPAAAPADGNVQVVLYQDESGGLTWHFADDHFRARVGTRSRARSATFTIPARTAAARKAFLGAQPATRIRGPITKLGRKILKVLLVPIAGLLANPVRAIVGRVERKKRQDLIRGVTAENYRQRVTDPFTKWNTLHRKRSLLIVHGIFSTTEGMLSGLPPAAMEALLARYEGRVIAFDQLTVTKDPEENARDFLRTVAASGKELEFDILCHSRGGIIARTLAERGRALMPDAHVSFPRVFFVATPNAGSPLGDAGHMVDLLDVFTNFITNFPDGPVTYSIEVLLSIVKLLAYTAIAKLPGIAAMGTNGYIKKKLNAMKSKPPSIYGAVAANYEPDPNADNGFFNSRISDAVIDRVFEQAANDLVVPRDGVFAANGHPSFPIANPLVYGVDDHVWHTDYFRRPRTIEKLLPFFDAGVPLIELTTPVPPALPASDSIGARAEDVVTRTPLPPTEILADMLMVGDAWVDFASAGPPLRIHERRRTAVRAGGGDGWPARARRRRNDPPPPRAQQSSSKPPEPATLERSPAIVFRERIREGETAPLIVRLDDIVQSGAAGNLLIDLLAEEQEMKLTVSLTASGFDVKPRAETQMTVKRARNPKTEEVTFKLTARNPGPALKKRQIIAEFWHRNASIGSVEHYTNVVPKKYKGVPVGDGRTVSQPFALIAAAREDCDLVITVEGEDDPATPPFRLRVRNTMNVDAVDSLSFGKLNLPSNDLANYISTTIGAVINKPNAQLMTSLRSLGKQLWSFLPKGFREYYFKMMSGPNPARSIRIHSEEMILPWELVVPHQSANGKYVELEPMGIAHVIGRWKPGTTLRPWPQRIRGEEFVILRPDYPPPDDLPWAKAEEVALQKLLAGTKVVKPADDEAVRSLLGRNDVRFIHFSGHGTFNSKNADLSELALENGTSMTVLDFVNNPLSATAHPIVYLNACELGTAGMTVGRAGGFAAACIESGYSGLIASYWAVNDQSVARLSIALYQKLLGGLAIGEALRELRAQYPNDPAFAAVAYYGDPWTRVDLTGLTARVRPAAARGRSAPTSSSAP